MLAKILVFLALVGLSASLIQNSLREDELESSLNPRDCPEGMYLNGISGECENCSKCGQFMYIRKECTKDTNTQCGWCGRKNIVSNKDFMRKCRFPGYFMYSDFREKLRQELGAEEEEDDAFTDPITDGFGDVQVVRLQNRPDLEEEDEKDLRLASEEDFMNRPVVYRRRIGQAAYDDEEDEDDEDYEEEDLASSEVAEEVHAEEVDEHDIGESPTSEEANEFDSLVEEVLADRMAQQKEVLTLIPVEEIPQLPLKFVVTGDIQKDEDSEEFDSSESSSEEHEIEEAVEEEERLYRSNSRMLLRICLMSLIIIIIYVWSSKFISRRRRHRILILPDLNNFTEEQKQMMDRCACQLKEKEEGHCYENKLAYI